MFTRLAASLCGRWAGQGRAKPSYAAVRREEERQRFALEAAGVGLWEWDVRSGKVIWSDLCRRIYGIEADPAAFNFAEWLMLVHPDDRERTTRLMRKVINGEMPELQGEFRIRHRDKGERWIQMLGRATLAGNRKVTGLAGVHIDVTERRLAAEAMAESEARYRTLFDMAPIGIVMVEPEDGRIVAFNSRAHQVLGYSQAEFAGMRLADVEACLDERRIKASLAEICSSATTVQFETQHRRKDGSLVDALAAAHRVTVGGRTYVYKTWLDITAFRAVERQLAAAKSEAERANQAKGQFLASASHDLRQPVQSLMFFHSALAVKLKGHPASVLLDNMQSGLDALMSLLDGLLDISKLHAGLVEVQPTAFPVGALLLRLEADYAGRAEDKGLDFRIVPTLAWVKSDMALLERILRHLIDNALKYTAHGGILIGCRRQGNSIRIDVVDTGTGIPSHRHEDIFHEFVQLGNAERDRSKGLGLGLAIVRQLGLLMGHDIAVRSRAGHGTTFSVTIPMAKPRSLPKPRRRYGPPRGLALVVDDEALVLVGLSAILEGMGWAVLAADSGEEALRLVSRSRAPDIIVADYRLRHGETGVAVIRDVHGVCGTAVPALVLTGDANPERVNECRHSGFRLLPKPISAQVLEAILADLPIQVA